MDSYRNRIEIGTMGNVMKNFRVWYKLTNNVKICIKKSNYKSTKLINVRLNKGKFCATRVLIKVYASS